MQKSKNNISLLFLLTAFVTIIIMNISCNDNPVGPGNEPPPGRRDYEWVIDTLKIPFNYLSKIWGNSPENIWAIGSGGSLSTTIWHFDGNNWSTDNISRQFVPTSIFGFSDNNVWVGGDNGKIWHYDGNQWTENFQFYPAGIYSSVFFDIWGDDPNNIYAVGYLYDNQKRLGLILHYNGTTWEKVEIPNLEIGFLKIRKSDNQKYYVYGWTDKPNKPDSTKIYEYVRNNIVEIYKGDFSTNEFSTLALVGTKVYFTIGYSIYDYVNKNFNPLITFNLHDFSSSVVGRNKNDLFLVMNDGVAHYNGSDTEYLYKNKGFLFGDQCIFNTSVFFLGNDFDSGLNLVIRGYLNNY